MVKASVLTWLFWGATNSRGLEKSDPEVQDFSAEEESLEEEATSKSVYLAIAPDHSQKKTVMRYANDNSDADTHLPLIMFRCHE